MTSILSGEFTASTGECDKRRAEERLPMIAAAYLARVKAARDRLADHAQRDLSEPEVQRLTAEFYARSLPMFMLRRAPDDHAAVVRTTEERLKALTAMVGREDFSPVFAVARTAIKEMPIPEDSPSLKPLHESLMRAFIELHEAALSRLRGEAVYIPKSITLPEPAAVAAPDRSVTALIDAYRTAKWDSWSKSVQIGIEPVFRLVRDAFPDRDVATINDEDAERLLALLKALPTNIGKRAALRGLSVPDAVEAGRKLGLTVIGPKTINTGYLVHIKAMFAWAVQRKWAAENPFSRMSVADPVEDQDRRDPFKPDDLTVLFGAAPWRPVDHNPARKPSRFWVPLMALFTGARLAELAGLRLEDIEEREGILVLNIRPHETRSIKTKSRRRIVPVHSELLRMGFAAYVEARRKAGGAVAVSGVRSEQPGAGGVQIVDMVHCPCPHPWHNRPGDGDALVPPRLRGSHPRSGDGGNRRGTAADGPGSVRLGPKLWRWQQHAHPAPEHRAHHLSRSGPVTSLHGRRVPVSVVEPSQLPAPASPENGPHQASTGVLVAPEKGENFTREELDYSRPIRWDRAAVTESGKAAVAAMLAPLEAGEARGRRRRPEDQERLVGTFTAILLDLYAAARATPTLFLAYPRNGNDFDLGRYGNQLVTLTAVRTITTYFDAARLTEGAPGYFDRSPGPFGGPGGRGRRARVRATPRLVTLLEEAGFAPADIGQLATAETIRLKAAVTARRQTKPLIEYDDTPETVSARQSLASINAILARTHIDLQGDAPAGRERAFEDTEVEPLPDINDRTARQLYRVFNNGSFAEGGRFYGGWWQAVRSADRKRLLINDEPTVELDFKSMHPRLCYQFEQIPLAPDIDPYLIPGLPESARELVKAAVVRLLNAAPGKSPKAPDGAASTLPPGMSWPQLLRRVEAHHRPIAAWFRAGRGMRLQHLDSAIAHTVLHYLTIRGIPCLPVHDSFIVPLSKQRQLGETMMLAYYGQSGKYGAAKVHPVITGWSSPSIQSLIRDHLEGV